MLPVLIAIPLILIWVLAIVDLVRRHDLATSSKVLWAILVLVLPIIGAIVYFVARPPDAAERFAVAGDLPHEASPSFDRVRDRHPS